MQTLSPESTGGETGSEEVEKLLCRRSQIASSSLPELLTAPEVKVLLPDGHREAAGRRGRLQRADRRFHQGNMAAALFLPLLTGPRATTRLIPSLFFVLQPFVLPTVEGKHQDLKYITPDTVSAALT